MARVASLYPNQMQPMLFKRNWHPTMRVFSSMNQFKADTDYYKMLGVKPNDSQDKIKQSFYELAKKHHPDSADSKKSDEERFKQITAAWDVLSNPQVKKQYDLQRASQAAAAHGQGPTRTYQPNSNAQGGTKTSGFNHDYRAESQQTYKYSQSSGSFRGHGQQSYEDFKKTQKDDDQYNYFYKDAREEQNPYNRRHDAQYQTSAEQRRRAKAKVKKEGQKMYGDVYGQANAQQGLPHMRIGYIFLALIMANMIVGVFTGRGKGRDFTQKADTIQSGPRVHSHYNPSGNKNHNDQILSMYHNKAGGNNQQMVQGSNVMTSTFIQPQYKTNVPGLARLNEEHPEGTKLFTRREGGDFANAKVTQSQGVDAAAYNMIQEELEIRRAGEKPSPEFLEEKKRLLRSQYERNMRQSDALYSAQEDYLSNIAEINKVHEQMGMPIIRTEIRYNTPTGEPNIPLLQISTPEPPPIDEPKRRAAKKKKKKKAPAKPTATPEQPPAAEVKISNRINYANRSGVGSTPPG